MSSEAARDPQHSEADAQAAVADLLRSLQGNTKLSGSSTTGSFQGKLFTTLPELLKPESTIEAINYAEQPVISQLLSELPTQLLVPQAGDFKLASLPPQTTESLIESLSISEKREILIKVLRSPQFTQSLASLTAALRDGGLPTISEALHVSVANGGYTQQGRVALGGGEAVEAFLEAVKDKVEKTPSSSKASEQMDSD